jgi:DNA-binding MarR family transcriptional regulator
LRRPNICAHSAEIDASEGAVASSGNDSLIHELTAQWRRERPDLDLQNFLLQIYLQRIGRIIEARFARLCLRRFGMRAQDMRLLLALRRGGAPFARRPTDLFRALLVTSGAVTKQVDRLVRKKLVRRLPDPDYRGGFLIQLTNRGLEVVDRAVEVIAHESYIGPAMAKLEPHQRDDAERFCLHLIEVLEAPQSRIAAARPQRGKARARRRA